MMKEIIRIFTVRITDIGKIEGDEKIVSKDKISNLLTRCLKRDLECDDVQVLDVQDFILDSDD